jgi:hypothetical protein
VRRGERKQDFIDADHRILRVHRIGEEDHEFIAAVATDRVGTAHAHEQTLRHRLQDAVAYAVPQGVVDVLEAVHVKIQHGQFLPVALRERHRLRQPVFQQYSVG